MSSTADFGGSCVCGVVTYAFATWTPVPKAPWYEITDELPQHADEPSKRD